MSLTAGARVVAHDACFFVSSPSVAPRPIDDNPTATRTKKGEKGLFVTIIIGNRRIQHGRVGICLSRSLSRRATGAINNGIIRVYTSREEEIKKKKNVADKLVYNFYFSFVLEPRLFRQ